MSGDAYDWLIFGGVVAAASLIGGVFLRHWWLGALVGTAIGGLVVPLYAVVESGLRVRPSDIAFWLPMMAFYSAAQAAPIAFGVGFVLHLVRKRKARL